jgi:hypothetical protein
MGSGCGHLPAQYSSAEPVAVAGRVPETTALNRCSCQDSGAEPLLSLIVADNSSAEPLLLLMMAG